MARINKVARVSLIGGIVGTLMTNQKKALEDKIDKENQHGWSVVHVESHRTTNLFIAALQFIVLVSTLGLITWGGGYLVLFEREMRSRITPRYRYRSKYTNALITPRYRYRSKYTNALSPEPNDSN